MNKELRIKKLLFYSAAYMTNINYLILLILMSVYLEFDKDPYLSIIIWGIPAAITVIASYFVINKNLADNLSREQGIIKLAIAHIPSWIGLTGAIIYLFVL